MARLGLLEDASPLFGPVSALPRAGALLALPALVQSGVFDCAQKIYGSLGPAFFGLRTTILILLLMACGGSNVRKGSKNIHPLIWAGCWEWIEPPRSKRSDANWLA
jgi:hypothetical protein